MGPLQRNIVGRVSASSGRFRRWPSQACVRKGCANVFSPRRWNQRYCQDEYCRRELRRWQNAQRQQRRRQRVEVRRQHAEQERARRRQPRSAARTVETSPAPAAPPTPDGGGAWSRSKRNSAPFCGRPGCFEPRPHGGRAPHRYCGRACGAVMRRVLERERKRLWRRKLRAVGTQHVARTAPPNGATVVATNAEAPSAPPAASAFSGEVLRVRNSRRAARKTVSFRPTPGDCPAETTSPHRVEEARHDRKTPARPRPRPPPAS